ncbi:uncharacterized protein LOC128238527 [Mya arenaria]|uniref:uncharacterized protein LOC128238527 n=1 Tax=Mya arenaria TaxID=6604 RepID=UPI0022E40C52|nr:uncharacterized protein LOC128238527 [Mya arenaria]
MMTAKAHVKANVTLEMKVMSEYFNTLIPGPAINSKFKCTGICEQKMQSLKLKRIFTTVMVQDQKDYMNTQLIPTHMACIVIGPDIYYRKCGGQCNLPDRYNRYCLPDVTVKIKVWVFCPNVSPGCHKVDFDVPISCSCKKIECNKGYDINKEWDARQGAVNPGNPIGVAIGLTG